MTVPGDVWLVVGAASLLLGGLSFIGSMLMRQFPVKSIGPLALGAFGLWKANQVIEYELYWLAPIDAVLRIYGTVF